MNVDPLQPSPTLLCKLGSIIVHADEMLSPGGHVFDKKALDVLLADPEVVDWLAGMNAMAMIPVKRSALPVIKRIGDPLPRKKLL